VGSLRVGPAFGRGSGVVVDKAFAVGGGSAPV